MGKSETVLLWKNKETGLYTLEFGDGKVYECLTKDEVQEVMKQEFEKYRV